MMLRTPMDPGVCHRIPELIDSLRFTRIVAILSMIAFRFGGLGSASVFADVFSNGK